MSAEFNSLTSKQKKVLSVIESFVKSRGIPPTVREIGEMVGEKTPGAVQGILNRLEQKGVIRREVGMARSIQLVSDNSQYLKPVFIPEVKRITRRNLNEFINIYNIRNYHPVSPDMVGESDNLFMIGCPDNSLSENGIKYEDTLIFSRDTENLKDGDIVLAMYEEHVILRYYHSSSIEGQLVLKAQSNLLGRESFQKTEVEIIGKLVAKFNKYQ